jgi:hypothetical protein
VRDTSETTGRVLRLNDHRKAHKDTIAMFDKAIESMLPGPLFLPALRVGTCNVSEPPHPHASLIEHTCLQPTLPITPSPEDSNKEDSSDKFEAMDHPRSQLPGAFFHMPNKPPFISSSLSLLTELSDQNSASPQAPTEHVHITTPTERNAPEIKQESFETPHMPNSILGGKILSNLPFAYAPPTSTKPIASAPTIVQHSTMSTMPYEMPFCGTDHAPKFDGTSDMLTEFIDAYEECTDRAGLQGLDKIKGIIKYLEHEDQELWVLRSYSRVTDPKGFGLSSYAVPLS